MVSIVHRHSPNFKIAVVGLLVQVESVLASGVGEELVLVIGGERFTNGVLMSESSKRRLTISLEMEDYRKVEHLAERDDRSLSWVIGEAVKCYLELARQSDSDRLPRHKQTELSL